MARNTPDQPPGPDPVDIETPVAASKVAARYVGVDPVMAPVNGVPTIITTGDLLMVSPEQLEQDPIFEPWED